MAAGQRVRVANGIMNEDATKIVYFAPSFNGLGIACELCAGRPRPPPTPPDTTNDGGQSEQITAALSYSMDVGGGSVSANVGTEMYTAEAERGGQYRRRCLRDALRPRRQHRPDRESAAPSSSKTVGAMRRTATPRIRREHGRTAR